MSIDLLEQSTTNLREVYQGWKHDIESLFYVLLYFCMLYQGPGLKKDPKSTGQACTDIWSDEPKTFRQLADTKVVVLTDFEARCFPHFHPYFHELRPCMIKLLDTVFRPYVSNEGSNRNIRGCIANHLQFLKVLEDTYRSLPDVD